MATRSPARRALAAVAADREYHRGEGGVDKVAGQRADPPVHVLQLQAVCFVLDIKSGFGPACLSIVMLLG